MHFSNVVVQDKEHRSHFKRKLMPYYIKSKLQSGKASLFSGDSNMSVAANKWKEMRKCFIKQPPLQVLKGKIHPKAVLQLSYYGIGGCCVLYPAKALYLDEQGQTGRNGIYIRIFERQRPFTVNSA